MCPIYFQCHFVCVLIRYYLLYSLSYFRPSILNDVGGVVVVGAGALSGLVIRHTFCLSVRCD